MIQTRAEYILSLYNNVSEKMSDEEAKRQQKEREAEKIYRAGAHGPSNPHRAWQKPVRHKEGSARRATAGKPGKTAHKRKGKVSGEQPMTPLQKKIAGEYGPHRERQSPQKAKNWAAKQKRKQQAHTRRQFS